MSKSRELRCKNYKINCKIVKEVKKYRFLYDRTQKHYRNLLKSMEAWKKISKKLGMHAGQCRRRWYALRTSFVASFEHDHPFYMAKELNFLIPHLACVRKKTGTSKKNTGIDSLILFLEEVFPYYDKLSPSNKLTVKHKINVVIEEQSHEQELEKLTKQK